MQPPTHTHSHPLTPAHSVGGCRSANETRPLRHQISNWRRLKFCLCRAVIWQCRKMRAPRVRAYLGPWASVIWGNLELRHVLPCTLSTCPMARWLFVCPGSGAAARFKCSSCHLGCGSITTTSRNMCGMRRRRAARGMRHAALLNRKQLRQKCFGTFYTFCCWARVCLDIWKTYCTIILYIQSSWWTCHWREQGKNTFLN